jgi:hypothetical protein
MSTDLPILLLNEIGKTYNIEPTYFDDNNDLIIEKEQPFITDVLAGNTALTSSDTDYASVKASKSED